MSDTGHETENFPDRIIFASVFGDAAGCRGQDVQFFCLAGMRVVREGEELAKKVLGFLAFETQATWLLANKKAHYQCQCVYDYERRCQDSSTSPLHSLAENKSTSSIFSASKTQTKDGACPPFDLLKKHATKRLTGEMREHPHCKERTTCPKNCSHPVLKNAKEENQLL